MYDSLHTRPNEQGSIVKQACTILKSQQSTIAVNMINVQIQDGASDCTLFALAMATDLCRGIDPIYVTHYQDKMRQHLAKSFEQLALSPFPSDINSSSEKSLDIHTTTVEIYCICHQPEFVPMFECDSCGVWYYAECVDLTGDVLEKMKTFRGFAPPVSACILGFIVNLLICFAGIETANIPKTNDLGSTCEGMCNTCAVLTLSTMVHTCHVYIFSNAQISCLT